MTRGLLIQRVGQGILVVLLFVFLFLTFYRPIEFEDGWWHLSTARWMVHHKQVPHENIFSHSATIKEPWTYSQWLGSIVLYENYRLGGGEGLRLFRALLLLLSIAIFIFYSYQKVPFPIFFVLTIIVMYGLSTRCLVRPLLFNFLFIQLYLIAIFSYLRSLNWRALIILPLLGALWVNIHIGSLVYGVFLVFIVFLAVLGEYIFLRLTKRASLEIDRARKKVIDLGVVTFACFGSLAINPYGWEGMFFPIKIFLFPEFAKFYDLRGIVEEMQPPLYLIHTSKGLPFVLLAVVGICVLIKSGKDRVILMTLFLYALFVLLQGARGSGFFALVGSFVIVISISQQITKAKWQTSKLGSRFDKIFLPIAILIVFLRIVFIWNQSTWYDHKQVRTLSLSYEVPNPMAAVDFINKSGMKGIVFNDLEWGGYLIWSSYPHLKPFVDGRQLHPEYFLRYYIEIFRDPQANWGKAEERFHFQIVLLKETEPYNNRLIEYLKTAPLWEKVYEDGSSIVFNKIKG